MHWEAIIIPRPEELRGGCLLELRGLSDSLKDRICSICQTIAWWDNTLTTPHFPFLTTAGTSQSPNELETRGQVYPDSAVHWSSASQGTGWGQEVLKRRMEHIQQIRQTYHVIME